MAAAGLMVVPNGDFFGVRNCVHGTVARVTVLGGARE
jgi:hypothetical protein